MAMAGLITKAQATQHAASHAAKLKPGEYIGAGHSGEKFYADGKGDVTVIGGPGTTTTEREFTRAMWSKVKRSALASSAAINKHTSEEGSFLDLVVTYNVWGDEKPMGEMTHDDLQAVEDLLRATTSRDYLMIALMRAYGVERVGELPAQVLEEVAGL